MERRVDLARDWRFVEVPARKLEVNSHLPATVSFLHEGVFVQIVIYTGFPLHLPVSPVQTESNRDLIRDVILADDGTGCICGDSDRLQFVDKCSDR